MKLIKLPRRTNSSKPSSSSSREKMAPKRCTSSSSAGKSLCGGTIDHEGVVQLQREVQQTSHQKTVVKTSSSATTKASLRLFNKTYRDPDVAETETNSSSDSVSVRDDNLDGFLDETLQQSFSDPADGNSGSGDNSPYGSWSNPELLQALEEAVEYEKYVLVGRYLQEMDRRNLKLPDPKRHAALKRNVQQVQEIIDSHSQDPEEGGGWKKQGLMHGKHRNTMVYYRTNDRGEVTVRCETPIQASLVAPLLAILNETDLYTTWCPSFQRPFKLGVTDTGRHKQLSRACQVAYAKVDMPWPMSNREVIVKNVMAEAVDEIGALVIRAKTMEVGEEEDGVIVPPCEPGWERIKMDGGLLLRKCPENHPALKKKKSKRASTTTTTTRQQQNAIRRNSIQTNGGGGGGDDDQEEPMLLATFTLFVTPSINTILKIIAGPMWSALVSFAEDVKNGKKGELHRERIDGKPELYGWVNETVERVTGACA